MTRDSLMHSALRAARRWQLSVALSVAVLVSTLAPLLAVAQRFRSALGRSVAGDAVLQNTNSQALFAVDFMHQYGTGAIMPLLALAVVISVLLHLFLTGGVITLLRGVEPFSTTALLTGSARLFKNQIGQQVMFLLLFLPLLSIGAGAIAAAAGAHPALAIVGALLTVPILAMVRTAADAARVLPVFRGDLGIVASWRQGWSVAVRAPLRAVMIAVFPLFVSVVVVAMLTALEWSIDATSSLRIAVVLFIAIVTTLARSAVRVAQLGAVVRLVALRVSADDEELAAAIEAQRVYEAALLEARREREEAEANARHRQAELDEVTLAEGEERRAAPVPTNALRSEDQLTQPEWDPEN